MYIHMYIFVRDSGRVADRKPIRKGDLGAGTRALINMALGLLMAQTMVTIPYHWIIPQLLCILILHFVPFISFSFILSLPPSIGDYLYTLPHKTQGSSHPCSCKGPSQKFAEAHETNKISFKPNPPPSPPPPLK